jgi:AcrR family transcriptional regulator
MNAYWQDSLAATSVNAICELANVSKPSLYREFGSEDGLTVAVLERYASQVLVQIEDLLMSDVSFATKLDELIKIASEDPHMETGCLFIKMRAGRSRFGVQTQAKLADIETQALSLYVRFFNNSHERGEWSASIPAELAATYLLEQFGLAVTQRAAGRSKESVRELLTLSLSAIK